MNKENNKSGFTLVELAIVLVIIGLIVGGVLVGQDLIKAASIRATVTDIEKFNAAATTFRGKYQGYPGDLVGTKASEFGMAVGTARSATAPAAGQGDGNGLVEGGAVAATNVLGYETALFWADLNKAGLVPSTSIFNGTTGTTVVATNAALGSYLPKTKLRDSALYTTFSQAGRNFYGISSWVAATGGVLTGTAGLSPLEARGIDEKLDDGIPTTGTVVAITGAMTTTAATPDTTAGTCLAGTAPFNYAASTDATLNAIGCSLSVRASF